MNLVQLLNAKGKRQVAARVDNTFRHVKRTRSILELAHAAIEARTSLSRIVEERGLGKGRRWHFDADEILRTLDR